MKLKNKLLISQILVFFIIFAVFTTVLSNIIYTSVSKTDLENVMNLNEQIMTHIDQYFEELQRFSLVVRDDEGLKELIGSYHKNPTRANQAKISLYLSGIGLRDHVRSYEMLGIYIESKDPKGERSFTTVGLPQELKRHIREVLPEAAAKENKAGFLDPFTYEGESATVFGNKFNMAYGYVSEYELEGISGTVTVIASFDPIIYIAESMSDYSKDYLLLNGENDIIAPSVKDSKINVERILESITYGRSYREGFVREKNAVSALHFSNYGNWKIICRLTREDILENNRSLILLDELLVAIFGICVILIMIPLVQKFTKPLSKLLDQMNQISAGNLNARVEITSKDEIAEVGKAFNSMAEQLQVNIGQMLEQEKREQKMKYSLLVSQVDPHFIYNTMNTITYLAQKGRNKDVIEVNKAMISILRDRLRIKIEDAYDTLEQELEVVKDYLTIQSYRYADTFKAQFFIAEETKYLFLAKNILQPLVENALFHGILCNKDEEGEIIGGCIKISTEKEGDYLLIRISDNGTGISEDILEKLETDVPSVIRGEHIGIRNIKGRIRYLYGEDYTFDIRSRELEGTTILIRLPLIRENLTVAIDKCPMM
ncbi:MAG: histidine kinase [Lachnospiraceae bacterium]